MQSKEAKGDSDLKAKLAYEEHSEKEVEKNLRNIKFYSAFDILKDE